MNFFHYQLIEKLSESGSHRLYRGIDRSNGRAVIVKMSQPNPSSRDIANYKRECEILQGLDCEGVARAYGIEDFHKTMLLAMEDFAGVPLKTLLAKKTVFTLVEFLPLAINLCQTLGDIHTAGIIHKNINSTNILFDTKTGQGKIVDFSIAIQLARENPVFKIPDAIEGELSYISPEQTGRTNCWLDHRADLYSLGVVFYELVTGKLPFAKQGVLELIHCHIAKKALTPEQINPRVPPVLSALIMKLLEKAPENRYQSARGVQVDLEKCLAQLQDTGDIAVFSLALQDFSKTLPISQKLYGREKQIGNLLAVFSRIYQRANSEVVLLTGYSGTGKTSLIKEIYKPLTEQNGLFISGKYEQYRKIPYFAIVQAFAGLVRQWLAASDSQVSLWKEKITTALGANCRIVVDMIPEMEMIVGPTPEPAKVGAPEMQNRFDSTWQKFIGICCAQQPLVLFLDDLQWADAASLRLIELAMTDTKLQNLLLIGAYRDNEVDSTHPLAMMVDTLRSKSVMTTEIVLKPLEFVDIANLLADTLNTTVESVAPLARLLKRKTHGNPFFIKEFLQNLHDEKLLAFDWHNRRWSWNIKRIKALQHTKNVLEMTIARLKNFPPASQKIVSTAAFLGGEFALHFLAIVLEVPIAQIEKDLALLVRSALVVVTTQTTNTSKVFKFTHDKVQKAAYELIPERDRKPLHLRIGRKLLQNTSPNEIPETVFAIVEHFNRSIDLLEQPKELLQIAELNLIAGQRAKQATALSSALTYLQHGVKLLPEQSWIDHYDLTLRIHREQAEVQLLLGNLQNCEEVVLSCLDHIVADLDKSEFYMLLIRKHFHQSEYGEALKMSRVALQLLGDDLPQRDIEKRVDDELQRVRKRVEGKSMAQLLELPKATERKQQITMQLFVLVMLVSTQSGQFNLFIRNALKALRLSLKFGYTPEIGFLYCLYGSVIIDRFGDYRQAYQLSELGLQLCEKFTDQRQKCKIYIALGISSHWVNPMRMSDSFFDSAFQIGVEIGDIQFAGFALKQKLFNYFHQGTKLGEISQAIAKFMPFFSETKNRLAMRVAQFTKMAVENLRTNFAASDCFDIAESKELDLIEQCTKERDGMALGCHYVAKAQVLYLYKEYQLAKDCLAKAGNWISTITRMSPHVGYHFYSSLVLLALYRHAPQSERNHYLTQIEPHQEQMKRWKELCPQNFLHKYLLVEAKLAELREDILLAIDNYEQAIAMARENDYLQDEALAYELAAEFYQRWNKETIAQCYFQKAHYAYGRWGATAKQQHLESCYPYLEKTSMPSPTAENIDTSSDTLDFTAAINASQALSSEINLQKLLAKLMKSILVIAGAQKGYVILYEKEELRIEAEGFSDPEKIEVLKSIPITEKNRYVPQTIIQYVIRTKKEIILENASDGEKFVQDAYISEYSPQSMLCIPLVRQQKVNGVLYLENNLTTGAFTKSHLKILRLLSSQAAISIDNARLYNQMEEQIEQRTKELVVAKEKAEVANQAKSVFLANMSHELRSPLNAILGFTQILSRSPLSTQQLEHADIVYRSAEHLLMLVNQVLNLSKIEQGHISLHKQDFDLYYLLDSLENMFALQLQQKALQFSISIAEDVPRYIHTDETKLRQILVNLLSNAIKFTFAGSITLRIKMANDYRSDSKEVAQRVAFAIADTGVGIAKTELSKLFSPFVQTEAGKKSKEGTGLGLSISRSYVRLMGGNMQVESAPGIGTTFHFDIVANVASTTSSLPNPKQALKPNQTDYRLLIVDDNWINRKLLTDLLQPLGFQLRQANNGRQAVAEWQEWQPHLIWMDMRMPVMDGYEATKLIKETAGPKTVIIAVTASSLEEEKNKILAIGCDDYVRKPYRDIDIFACLHHHLDIDYINQEEPILTETITPKTLPPLPQEWFQQFKNAIVRADFLVMQSLVEKIQESHKNLADTLKRLLHEFQYDEILAIIKNEAEKQATTEVKNG